MKRKELTKRSCQVKTIPKIREKLGLIRIYPPTPYPIFFFFGNIWKHENNTENTHKHNISKKKLKSELGLDPPTHFRVFLGFLDFFQLDKFHKTCMTFSYFKKNLVSSIHTKICQRCKGLAYSSH